MGYYDEQKKLYLAIDQLIKTAQKMGVKKLNQNQIIINLTLDYAISDKSIKKRFMQLEKTGTIRIKDDEIIILPNDENVGQQ